MYKLGNKEHKRRRRLLWSVLFILLVVGLGGGGLVIKSKLKPVATIKQSAAVITKVNYNTKLTHYDEPDFGIDIPSDWQAVPAPAGPYKTYNWQVSDHSTNGQDITIYEDTIPANFAVNREVVVQGEQTQVTVEGQASDNCSQYTYGHSSTPNQVGELAKWQGISFLCDQENKERDVLGTSSTDGINVVVLKNTYGGTHKFLFTYSDQFQNPDYSIFYNAIASLRMK